MLFALIFTMSRPFHFSLEKVLEYRKQIEDQARLAFSRAQASEREQRRTLERLQEDLEKCLEEMPRSGRTNPQELWLWAEWRRHLEVDTKEAEAELDRRHTLKYCTVFAVNRYYIYISSGAWSLCALAMFLS